MKEAINIHMYARASKPNYLGQLPIYVRITIQGKRKEFTTKIYVEVEKWNSKAYRINGNSDETRITNSYLDSIRLKIHQTFLKLSLHNEEVTMDSFSHAYLGTKTKIRTLIPIFKNHNQKIKELIGREYAMGTYVRYETTLAHIQKFLKWKFAQNDIEITKINNAFVNDLDFYLRTEHNCANNTVMKYIKNFKKIVHICIANGWIDKDPFINFKTKFIEIEKTFLNQDELDLIIKKQIQFPRLDLVRDIFIFACYTGLAYIDVKQLTPDHITKGVDGENWIYTHRQKTDSPSRIPLLKIPLAIIQKYKDHPKSDNESLLLPILSNQSMNAYLKEIADICGINKVLTFHCARHTFATTVTLSNGVPIETVSKMLGHKSIKITQHYAKITDKKVANDMKELKDKLDTD